MRNRQPTGRRAARVGLLIRDFLATHLIAHARDPLLRKAVVSEVVPTPDLRLAKVYFVPLDDSASPDDLKAAFERSLGYLRGEMGRQLQLRYVPELTFLLDERLIRSRRIESLLEQLPETRAGGEQDGEDETA